MSAPARKNAAGAHWSEKVWLSYIAIVFPFYSPNGVTENPFYTSQSSTISRTSPGRRIQVSYGMRIDLFRAKAATDCWNRRATIETVPGRIRWLGTPNSRLPARRFTPTYRKGAPFPRKALGLERCRNLPFVDRPMIFTPPPNSMPAIRSPLMFRSALLEKRMESKRRSFSLITMKDVGS